MPDLGGSFPIFLWTRRQLVQHNSQRPTNTSLCAGGSSFSANGRVQTTQRSIFTCVGRFRSLCQLHNVASRRCVRSRSSLPASRAAGGDARRHPVCVLTKELLEARKEHFHPNTEPKYRWSTTNSSHNCNSMNRWVLKKRGMLQPLNKWNSA